MAVEPVYNDGDRRFGRIDWDRIFISCVDF